MEASDQLTDAPPEQAEPEAPEAASDEPESPPDVGEALQSMQAEIKALREERTEQPQNQDFLTELYDEVANEQPEEDEGEYAELEPAPAQSDEEQIRAIFREEATSIFREETAKATAQQRQQVIAKLPEKYPRLAEKEVIDGVAANLREMSAEVGNAVWNSPTAVVQAYRAFEAERARAAENSSEEETRKANLEQGGGEAAPEPEVSETEQAYAGVFEQVKGTDPLTT